MLMTRPGTTAVPCAEARIARPGAPQAMETLCSTFAELGTMNRGGRSARLDLGTEGSNPAYLAYIKVSVAEDPAREQTTK